MHPYTYEEHLGCFQALSVMHKAVTDIHVGSFHVGLSFISFGKMDKYQGTWLLDCMVRMFRFVRNDQPVFQSGWIVFHFHQYCMIIPGAASLSAFSTVST